ncbi:MAG: hypothetical protein Q4E89_11295 [Eubacteriales bacterium]|nr:hypothetical protein [Eubacteriales bacterium]
MRKRIMCALLGGGLAAAIWGSSIQAETWGYDLGGENGEATLYITKGAEDQTASTVSLSEGEIREWGSYDSMSEEERKRLSDWHKEEMRQAIASLEKYGVSYDADKDVLLYQGKTVRWLIDEQIDNTCRAIEMPEGEIDLYTERADDFQLTGVRTATQEEYDERTRIEEAGGTMALSSRYSLRSSEEEQDGSVVHSYAEADTHAQASEGTGEKSAQDLTETTQVTEDTGEYTDQNMDAAVAYETAQALGSYPDTEEYVPKKLEYEKAGITVKEGDGSYLWNGTPIYWLMDEDGSVYQNGSEEARENKLYIIVKRNENGTIKEAKQATIEEMTVQRMLQDEKNN